MNAASAKAASTDAISKYITVLETRLDRSLIRFNEIVHTNSQLRDQTDSLRREKQIHSDIENRLQCEISRLKKLSDQLVLDTTASYAAKDKAFTELSHFRQIADREHVEFEREWKEINRLLETDNRVVEYVKEMEVVQVDLEPVCVEVIPLSEPEVSCPDVSRFESIFSRIKESTGIETIEELIKCFNENEIKNFSLFNHLNVLQGEFDRVAVLLESAQTEFKQVRKQQVISNDFGVETLVENSELIENKCEKLSFLLTRAENCIANICFKLGPLPNEYTIIQLLAII